MTTKQTLLYFDNAATSFPKPEGVAQAMTCHLSQRSVNPGRSGFDLSLAAGQDIDRVRATLDRFFNNPARDPNRVIFTANATAALNTAIQGVCRPGDHVITTVLDHNSVLRPLFEMQKRGLISWDVVACDQRGLVDPGQVAKLLRPETRLVVMTHASNVVGRVQPAAAIGRMCRERGVLFLLDAAQTAGCWPVDMENLNADLLVFTGHKSLLGPTGTGGLLVGPGVRVNSTRWGGTGVRSAEPGHLEELPYRLEAGTLNAVGIMGLAASLEWIAGKTVAAIYRHERDLAQRLLSQTAGIPGLKWLGFAIDKPTDLDPDQLAVLSCNIDGLDPAAVGMFLDADFDLAVRTGLQCAPQAHQALGTFPKGTIRFSIGPFNTVEQIDLAAQALAAIAT